MNVLIIGVSTGIGNSLAKLFLDKGFDVYGCSRIEPENLIKHPKFNFKSIDLTDLNSVSDKIQKFVIQKNGINSFKYVFLNAGRFCKEITKVSKVSIDELTEIMSTNVWGHKLILDVLIHNEVDIDVCMFSSSIAGVRARAGTSGYAITKSTLNMMAKLYAIEHPHIFFSVMGLCNVDTTLARLGFTLPLEGDFPEIVKLRKRAGAIEEYVVSPDERAINMVELLESNLKQRTSSGEFVEIRDLLRASP